MVTSGRRSTAITLSLNARGSWPQGSNAKKGLPLVPSLTTQVYSPRSVIGSSSQHISTGMLVLRYEKQGLSILFLRSLVESKTASLAGTIRKDDDILAHCEIFL